MSLTGKRINSVSSIFTKKSSKEVREPFVPANYVRYGLSERDVLLYKEIFDLMDPKQSGVVRPNDFRAALQSLDIHISRADLYSLFCDYDSEEGGVLTFKNFIDAVTGTTRPCDQDTREDYYQVFKVLSSNKPTIGKNDLQKHIRAIGHHQSDEDCQKLFDKLGVQDGEISFEVFYKTMTDFIYGDKYRHIIEPGSIKELSLWNKGASARSISFLSNSHVHTFKDLDTSKISLNDYSRSKTTK